jgi:thiamine biosynthesis lipoprotein
VSKDLFLVLSASQELAARSEGAFDVTLGPVIRLWRQARKENRLPEAAALQQATARCGYRKLHLNPEQRAVTLAGPGMQLDLGGIAKGYAAEAALEILRELGIRRALVAISGDIACGDPPPGENGWRVAAEPVAEPGDEASASSLAAPLLELSNTAISTSGDSAQHLDVAGKRYSHIIDPATQHGITNGIGVTVIAARGLDADGLATAVSLLSPERALKLIEKYKPAAALITIRENKTIRVVESPSFRQFVLPNRQRTE